MNTKPDKIDLKILKHLDEDPKITTTQLAKACLVSQQVADYRLKNLKSREVILGYPTIINFFCLGYNAYVLLLKTSPLIADKKTELDEYLKKESNIYSAKITGGNYDYSIVILSKNYAELETKLNILFSKFDSFTDYEIYPITEIGYYKHKTLNQNNFEKLTISQQQIINDIDDVDIKILEDISKDCRNSNLEIGKKLGLNYNTIKNRINALEKKKIIVGHNITLNPEALGLQQFNLLISFNTYSKKDKEKFISLCNTHEEIRYITHLLGGIWSFQVGVQTKSLETLQTTIGILRSSFKSIDNIQVVPIFNEIRKDTFPIVLDTYNTQ
ncbi:MAG: winged helix-turn-helix transcriptional regulator [Candidatus Woesearchaeota archaeon]